MIVRERGQDHYQQRRRSRRHLTTTCIPRAICPRWWMPTHRGSRPKSRRAARTFPIILDAEGASLDGRTRVTVCKAAGEDAVSG